VEFDSDEIRELFHVEARENLDCMEHILLELESQPASRETRLVEMLRAAHTLKGNSAMMGYTGIAEATHRLEDGIQRLKEGTLAISPGRVSAVLAVVAARRGQRLITARDATARPGSQPILALLTRALAPAPGEPGDARDASGAGVAAGAVDSRPAESAPGVLRVGVAKLNRLLDLTGEIVIAQGRVDSLLAPAARTDATLAMALWQLHQLQGELQGQVIQARMVPLAPVFRQHVRTVRDLGARLGKEVTLAIEDHEAEVDTSIAEKIRDPLVHMLRNAVDHGLEPAPERRAAGKPACGCITLRAFHEAGAVVIELADDGRGLDGPRILARAVERGLVDAQTSLTEQEVFQLIFEPGFSTAHAVTEVSGRGVGMDVVRRHVHELRGTIAIRSQRGHGTVITIRLPLTVAIIPGFTVGVGDERYVVPMEAVEECIELPGSECGRVERCGLLSLRGAPLPVVGLRELFSLGGEPSERPSVVVLRQGHHHLGLIVDELVGETQAVVKPLTAGLRNVPGVSGSTILGCGRVALLLDVPALAELAMAAR
jgi:two-component system chemotaxis sensor kinase CheA